MSSIQLFALVEEKYPAINAWIHISAVSVRGFLQHLQEILGSVDDLQLYSYSLCHPAGVAAASQVRRMAIA
jgi:hypothetical protein